MSKKLKVVICVVMSCVFLLIPFSAFAKTDNVSANDLIRIAKGANPDMYPIDSGHSTAIFEDNDNYYIVVVSRTVTYRCAKYGTVFECVRPYDLQPFDYQKYTFPKLNVYDVTFETTYCKPVIDRFYWFGYPTNFIYANQNVYGKWQGEDTDTSVIFFQRMDSIPNNRPSRVPLNTVISSIQLTGILSELIAMLPLLLPVLITFLAIRKGIRFCLQMLIIS